MKYLFRVIIFMLVGVYISGCATLPENHVKPATGDSPISEVNEETREKFFQALNAVAESGEKTATLNLDENPDLIQKGDLVTIHVTARTEDGRLVNTTVADIADRNDQKWLRGFEKGERYHPVEVIAGEENEFPGVNEVIIGMQKGEKKTTLIPPEKAFNAVDSQKIKQFPSLRRLPRLAQIKPVDFVKQFNIFPVAGNQIAFNPYLNADILEVTPDRAILELSQKPEQQMEQVSYGKTRVTMENDEFIIRLDPEVGALFTLDKERGWITEAENETFTVDFNHPMAGKSMVLEVDVLDFVKASVINENSISWLEDYDSGEEKSRRENKPMVLFLYADWCQWSRKMMQEVLQDPRIMKLHDRFIWVKINSDVNREYKEGFEQQSYPMTVLIDPQGEVIKSLEGFNNVHIVSELLHETKPLSRAG